jgi:hypothetical protein
MADPFSAFGAPPVATSNAVMSAAIDAAFMNGYPTTAFGTGFFSPIAKRRSAAC